MSKYSLMISAKRTNDWNQCISNGLDIGNTLQMSLYLRCLRVMPLYVQVFRENKCIACWIIYKHRIEKKKLLWARTFPNINEDYENVFKYILKELSLKYAGYKLKIDSYAFARNQNLELLCNNNFKELKAYTAYVNEIFFDDSKILSQFRKTHKQDTKKAISEEYEYRTNVSVREYYKLSKETYSRSEKKSGISYKGIKRWKKIYRDNGIISGVYVDGKLQAASMIPFYKEKAVYWHGASANDKARGVTAYLQYMNMLYLRQRGVKWYDLTGTSIFYDNGNVEYTDEKACSLDQFKRRFGGEQQIHFSGECDL